jgi:serine/threonine-protein kinase
MTQTGTVLGTSDYIAPEQAQGQRVDEHTDVYSLGVVLYELLTNEVPFPGENFVAVAMRHINEDPPPIRDKRPDVSPRLEAAVHRAMAKRPEDRFQTMADFCRELEANLAEAQGHTVVAPPPPPRRARAPRKQGANPWPIVLALLTLIAIGGVIAYLVINHNNNGNGGSTPRGGSGGAPALSAIGAFDPYGTGGENDARAKYATDNDAATYWETERYYDAPRLNKPGVGLVLDAKSVTQLHQLGVATSTPGFTAVIKAGDSATQFPDIVSTSQTVPSEGATFTIVGKPHRYYLLWITQLGPSYNTVRINEIKAT